MITRDNCTNDNNKNNGLKWSLKLDLWKTLSLLVFYHDFLSQSQAFNNKKKVIHFSTASTVFTKIKKLVELLLKLEFICKTIVILQLFNILYCHLV